MPNAIIYTRVSTDEQADKGYSLRDQKERLEKYCQISGLTILDHYQDDHSAKTFDRPAFQKLLSFCKKNKYQVDILLVVKWDRFSRNATDALMMLRTFSKLAIDVNAVEQPIDISIPEQKMMLSFYLTAPEVENDRRALNTSGGMRRAKKEGRWVAGAPFGYRFTRDAANKPLLVQNDKAEVVKKAFEMYATGIYDKEEVRKKLISQGMSLSRAAFWNMLHNVLYCGFIKLEATKTEPEEIVRALHQPIISKDLFEKVQIIASGKKMVKAKPEKVCEALPMRGYLVCSRCGSNLTGSASKGNGGRYYYYHCQSGCKERHKATFAHERFSTWLKGISVDKNVAELYLAIMQDIFKTEEGDRDKEIAKLETALNNNNLLLNQSVKKLVSGELDKWGYSVFKENITQENVELSRQLNMLKETDTGFDAYLKYGFSLLSNLQHYYDTAELQGKQKFLGLIFPEKLVLENGEYRTNEPSELLSLLCSADNGFSSSQSKKGGNSAHPSREVASTGIEPVSGASETLILSIVLRGQ